MSGELVPDAAVEAAGLVLGAALQETSDDYYTAEWAEWHPCRSCPMTGQPCACSGASYARPSLVRPALEAAAPYIAAAALRQVAGGSES